MKQYGYILKTIRKESGLTQEVFGPIIGKDQSDISDCENAKDYLKIPEWVMISKIFKENKVIKGLAEMVANALKYEEIIDFERLKLA